MKYVLDTHAWIWWNMHPAKLSAKVRTLLSTPKRYEELLLSAISPWEFSKLLQKGRIGISCSHDEWISQAMTMPKLRLVSLTPTIAVRSTTLPQSFAGDPADEIIIATAREENATLITRDKRIQKFKPVRSFW